MKNTVWLVLVIIIGSVWRHQLHLLALNFTLSNLITWNKTKS